MNRCCTVECNTKQFFTKILKNVVMKLQKIVFKTLCIEQNPGIPILKLPAAVYLSKVPVFFVTMLTRKIIIV